MVRCEGCLQESNVRVSHFDQNIGTDNGLAKIDIRRNIDITVPRYPVESWR